MIGDRRILDAIARFPETFGFRGFPGDTFRLSERASYIGDDGVVRLYTQRYDSARGWLDFAKGTEAEIRRELVCL